MHILTVKTDRKILGHKIKDIWFSDKLYEVSGFDEVNFISLKNKIDNKIYDLEENTTLIINLNNDLNSIWNDFSRKSCRYSIKKAYSENIHVYKNKYYEEAFLINKKFLKEKKLFKPASIDFMKKYGTLFTAELNGEIIAGQFFLENINTIRLVFAFSKRFEKRISKKIGWANRLLIWEAIQYAHNKEINEFDMGGFYTGSTDKELMGINFFKKGFGGKLTKRYNYRKTYSMSLQIIRKLAFYFILFRKWWVF